MPRALVFCPPGRAAESCRRCGAGGACSIWLWCRRYPGWLRTAARCQGRPLSPGCSARAAGSSALLACQQPLPAAAEPEPPALGARRTDRTAETCSWQGVGAAHSTQSAALQQRRFATFVTPGRLRASLFGGMQLAAGVTARAADRHWPQQTRHRRGGVSVRAGLCVGSATVERRPPRGHCAQPWSHYASRRRPQLPLSCQPASAVAVRCIAGRCLGASRRSVSQPAGVSI